MPMRLPTELAAKVEAAGTVTRTNPAAMRTDSPPVTPTPTRRNPNRTAAGKRNKFRNFKVYETPDGRSAADDHDGPKTKVADSRKEYARRLQLLTELRAGRIQALEFQKTFVLHGLDGSIVARIIPDFVYVKRGKRIVEDVKPMRKVKDKAGGWKRHANGEFVLKPFATPAYFLKKKMLRAEYGIEIQEF